MLIRRDSTRQRDLAFHQGSEADATPNLPERAIEPAKPSLRSLSLVKLRLSARFKNRDRNLSSQLDCAHSAIHAPVQRTGGTKDSIECHGGCSTRNLDTPLPELPRTVESIDHHRGSGIDCEVLHRPPQNAEAQRFPRWNHACEDCTCTPRVLIIHCGSLSDGA